MRLYQVGILLIILAVLIPIIAVILTIVTGVSATTTTPSVGGAIVIFPIVPIPILITFGKPQIAQPLLWFTYVIFIIFLVLIIFSIIQYYRVRREAMKRWQEEHR